MAAPNKRVKQALFKRDKLNCTLTKITKSGPILRNKKLADLAQVEEKIRAHFDGRILYDIVYDGDVTFKTLSMTEICTHGLMIHPCNYLVRDSNIREAAEDTDHDNEDVLARIRESGTTLDKYRLLPTPFVPEGRPVAFLPGSNIFDLTVDLKKLDQAVEAGAIIKPHPITNHDVLRRQERRYGKDKIANPKSSGYAYLKASSEIYTTGGSELSIYAVMLGKPVKSIEKYQTQKMPVYRPFFEIARHHETPYQAINNVFNSHKSGVFFTWDSEDKIARHIEYARAKIENLRGK